MLRLDNVQVALGKQRWRFDQTLSTHGTYALMGRSGSGKSTLLNVVGGFIQAESGRVLWKEQIIDTLSPAQRPVTTLFQQNNLFQHLNVLQNIGLGVNPTLKLDKQQRKDISTVLEQVGLSGYESKSPGSLSGGEQQRVALARCLMRKRDILLLDEPFSALDATTRKEMINLLQTLIDIDHPCVLMITHDHGDAQAINAEVLSIKEGSLVSATT